MYYKKSNSAPLSAEAALSKVQYLCSKQEKCLSEIRKKLRDWQLPEEEQEQILASLVEDRFIDESRFTEFFVRDKFRFNKWGRIKITYQLKMKEIPDALIQAVLDSIKEEEYRETLEELLTQKLRSMKQEDPYQMKGKLLRFAQGRGFEAQLTLNLIDKLI